MKTIIVKWVKENSIYGYAMMVIESDHPRFKNGSRFDFGFMSIATDDGYTIISLPPDKRKNKKDDKILDRIGLFSEKKKKVSKLKRHPISMLR